MAGEMNCLEDGGITSFRRASSWAGVRRQGDTRVYGLPEEKQTSWKSEKRGLELVFPATMTLRQFSTAALTNHHKLGSLKQDLEATLSVYQQMNG